MFHLEAITPCPKGFDVEGMSPRLRTLTIEEELLTWHNCLLIKSLISIIPNGTSRENYEAVTIDWHTT